MSETRAGLVVAELARTYPDAVCELDYRTPRELLVATVLSAQCTDQRVNRVTPDLFSRWPRCATGSASSRSRFFAGLDPGSDDQTPPSACILGDRGGCGVAEPLTVLIADTDDERRRGLGLALYEGGIEVVNAVNAEEALRYTAGLDPSLVVIASNLDGISPMDLYTRLAGTGLGLPPFLVLTESIVDNEDAVEGGDFLFLAADGLEPARFLLQVRLLMLAREVGAEIGNTLDSLFGDLTRIAVGDLLRVLERDSITGHVRFRVGPGAGIWLDDGKVVQAYWGSLKGRKAFNRIAGLHQGAFVLDLVPAAVEPAIDVDLGVLVSDAIEERLQLEDLFAGLPSLNSRVDIQMGNDFFAIDFTPLEREVLTQIQGARNLGDLINRVTMTDLETVQAIDRLAAMGVLQIREPSNRIHLVTDSTCDLLPSFVRRQSIHIVPLSVVFGTTVYKDGVDLLPDEFYQMLEGGDIFPSTSPPGKGEFLEIYRRLVATGDVVSIHISAKQSQTSQHAAAAANDGANEFAQLRLEADGLGVPDLRIIDSKSNSVGLGLLVAFASRMIERGLGVDEIVARVEDIRERMEFLFLVDTLEFLRKGGRIGQAQALIGTLLGIKPILGMVDGEVVPVDKVRGGRKAQPRLIEILRERVDVSRPVFVAMAHASAPKWGERIKELLTDSFDIVEMLEGEIGPVVGAHAGPGAVGCIVFQPTDEELELLKSRD